MRTTLLGSLLDALRRNRSRGFEDVRLFEAGSVYLPRASAGELATAATGNPWYPANDPDAAGRAHAHRRADLTGHVRPPSWGDPEPPRADLFAAKGVLEAMLRALRVDWSVEPGAGEPFLHPTPVGLRAARRDAARAGSASCTRRWPPRGTSTPWPASSSTSACSPRRRPASRATRTSPRSPPSARTSRSWSPTTSPPRSVLEVVRSAGGALLRDARRVRRLPRRAGGGGPRLARAAARVPRARPHPDRRGGRAAAGEDRRRAARPGRGRAAWLGSACSAPAATPARSPRGSIDRHPFFELAHVTARSEAGARLDDIHPRTRVPMVLETWDPDRQSDVDAALVCWPHRAAAPAVAALRERGVRVVDLSADFRLTDRAIYEDWYGAHGAPELLRHRRLRAARAAPRRDRGRRPRRQPRLLPDRRAARARAARPRRADRATS